MTADDQTGDAPTERRKRMFLDALARLVAKRVLKRLRPEIETDKQRPEEGGRRIDEETGNETK